MTVLTGTKGFCVLVCLVPRVTYHATEEFLSLSDVIQYALRQKREPITALTFANVMTTSLAGLGTGVVSVVTQQCYYADLLISIDEDIQRIETSIYHP